jgi:allantoin racemase
MRIWHQSFTDLERFPVYAATLQHHADAVLGSGEVVVHGLLPGTYPDGVPPMDANRFPYIKALNELQLCEAALTAEASGYDAFALACFFDPGLRLVRSIVDIPVLSLAETCMLAACSLGSTFATISLSPFQRTLTEQLVVEYGLKDRFVCAIELRPTISLFDLEREDAIAGITERFRAACISALDQGAEVIIPGDGVLNEFVVRHGLLEVEGATVMDSLGVLFEQTAAAVRVRASTGLTISRRGRYARPPAAILSHAREVAGRMPVAEREFSSLPGTGTFSPAPPTA